uniref:Uncharacterized protein n=1 Tax=Glossina austeni TaxID=7395 RepID=A0A1A9VKR5_GLOAU
MGSITTIFTQIIAATTTTTTTVASSAASESLSSSPDRVLTRSATCLALLGIALSSFSLKQMLANSTNKSSSIPMRKLY